MKRLNLIFLAAAIALGVVFWQHDDATIVDRETRGAAFLPELVANVNDALRLQLTKNDERVELERRGDDWVVTSSAGYPAKFDAVRSLLIGLARLESAEPRTNQSDRLGELLLDAEGDQAGTRVTVEGAQGERLADVIIGKARWQPSPGVYVRHADDEQAYLALGSLRVVTAKTNWLDTTLVTLPATDLAAVEIAGDLDARVARDSAGGFVLERGLPQGRALRTPNPFAALTSLLARLSFEDVVPADAMPGEPVRQLTFETRDGGSVALDLALDGEDLWVRMAAQASAEPEAAVGPPAPETDEQVAEVQAPKISTEQAEQWNAAWAPWAFQLPSYRKSTLMGGLEDWLEPEASEATAPADESAAAELQPPTDG